jgi:hypothetical protein
MKASNKTLCSAVLLGCCLGAIGCASNPSADRDHGDTWNGAFGESDYTNSPRQAGYHEYPSTQPSDRGDTGNGAFGETPP